MKHPELYKFVLSLSEITPLEWEEFTESFRQMEFQKGEFLTKPEQEATHFFVILKGMARNFDQDEKGKEYTKVFRGPGEIIGPYAEALAQTKTRFFIQALTTTSVISFPYQKFQQMMAKSHAWEKLGRVIAERNYLEKEKREYELLHFSADIRYQNFLAQYGALAQEIPQYHVASLLGISAEALNRLIKKSTTP